MPTLAGERGIEQRYCIVFGPSKRDLRRQIDDLTQRTWALEERDLDRISEINELRAKLANAQTWINLTLGLQGKELHHVPAQPERTLPAEPERWEIRDIDAAPQRGANGRFAARK